MAKKSTNKNFDIKHLLDTSGSYKNLIYGAVTVLILAVIVFLGIRTISQNKGDINGDAVVVKEEESIYEVSKGDTLWSISEKVYGTGFNWQLIADTNKLEDPNNIEAGTKLSIPKLTPTVTEEVEVGESEQEAKIEPVQDKDTETEISKDDKKATEYVAKSGDNLWKIAVEQYGDGYKWVEIAKANSLVNPDIIHAGNSFAIPR